MTSQGALAALIKGGTIGKLSKIRNLDIPLKGDLGLIGFGVSAVLLLAVSFLDLKWSSLRNTR